MFSPTVLQGGGFTLMYTEGKYLPPFKVPTFLLQVILRLARKRILLINAYPDRDY